jgi:hypothetical protein
VAKGGKQVHEELRKLFAQQLLRIDPRFDGIRPRRFRLGTLAGRPTLPTDPEDGIKRARVRRLKLMPTSNRPGALVIEGPSDRPDVSAQGLSADWFQDWDPMHRGFHIVQATISIHFCSIDGRRPRTIHLDLTSLGSSNLKRFKQDDRILLEKYLEKWRIIEPNE